MAKRKTNKNKNYEQTIDINNVFEFNEKQKQLIDITLKSDILLLDGPSGTAKTTIAVYCALKLLLSRQIDRILYIRNPVEVGKSIGFLKGELEEKFNPYIEPLMDKLRFFLSQKDILSYTGTGLSTCKPIIEACPVNFIRGHDWRKVCVIADESENFDEHTIFTIMTRLNTGSKIYLIGDSMQADIRNSGWSKMFDLFNNSQSQEFGINTFSFTKEDVMRNSAVSYIVDVVASDREKSKIKRTAVEKFREKEAQEWTPQRN